MKAERSRERFATAARMHPMGIDILARQGMFFGPDATRAMGAAFDKVCSTLGDNDQPNVVKEVIAKKIIELVRKGDSNPDHLCMVTLKSLGFDLGAN
jgi:hypothetical protein